MPKYIIERTVPGAGQLSADDLKGISRKSCDVLDSMGPRIQWIHSYVAGDKIYCIYRADNEDQIRKHAKEGGFPADSVTRISNVIEPTTSE